MSHEVTTIAKALRRLLSTHKAAAPREAAFDRLRRELIECIECHPDADRFVTDLRENYSRWWRTDHVPRKATRRTKRLSIAELLVRARTLIDLQPTVNAYATAGMALIVHGHNSEARRVIERGIDSLGTSGYAAILAQQLGLIETLEGNAERAIPWYRRASESSVASLRVGGLVSGWFAANDASRDAVAAKLVERMRREERPELIATIERIGELRRRRLGEHAVRPDLRRLRQQLVSSRGRPLATA